MWRHLTRSATWSISCPSRACLHRRNFCRATLCISAVYAVMRCPSVRSSVRPSVCPYVTFVHYFTIFSPSSSHTILAFPYQRYGNILTGTPYPLQGHWMQVGRLFSAIYLASSRAVNGSTATCNTLSWDEQCRASCWQLTFVCWLREMTTKCLWQEASTLRLRQQSSI